MRLARAAASAPRLSSERPSILDTTGFQLSRRAAPTSERPEIWVVLSFAAALAVPYVPALPLPTALAAPVASIQRTMKIAAWESSAPIKAEAALPIAIPEAVADAARSWGTVARISSWGADGFWAEAPAGPTPQAGSAVLGVGPGGIALVGIASRAAGGRIWVEDLFARGDAIGVRIEGGPTSVLLERKNGRLLLANLPLGAKLVEGAEVRTIGGRVGPDLPIGRVGSGRVQSGVDLEAEVIPFTEAAGCRFALFPR